MVLEVKVERVRQGMKLWELAQKLKMDPQRWRRFETGQQKVPPEVVKKVAKALGVPEEGLFSPVQE